MIGKVAFALTQPFRAIYGNSYLQVDLGQPKAVTAIMTQGVRRYLRNQYLTKFTVSYSKDGDLWIQYNVGGSPKVEFEFQ